MRYDGRLELDEERFQRGKDTEELLSAWANLKGHDRCWHHPEILKKLCEIWDITVSNDPCLPTREEFEKGCQKYQNELYNIER